MSLFKAVEDILSKLKDFIHSRKHQTDSRLIEEAEARIREYKKEQEKLEKELKEMGEKESMISEAEKDVFRIMSEENELVSKLSLLKAREERLALEEEEFKRELIEVGHLVGTEIAKYKEFEAGDEKEVAIEERSSQEERKRAVVKLKLRLEDSNISGMAEVEKEFKETSERDEFLARELSDLEKSSESLRELIKDLEERLATEFANGLAKINEGFGKMFSTMFGGGDASLELTKESKKSDAGDGEMLEMPEDEDEPAEEGLDIKVSLPKKKIRSLMMLSGGERALTSIALIFAVSQVNPPPFVILDETDAALDEANSRKYGDLVELLSKHSQLILITHNRETMSRAGVIYGVTMGSNGVSKLLSISFDEAAEVAK